MARLTVELIEKVAELISKSPGLADSIGLASYLIREMSSLGSFSDDDILRVLKTLRKDIAENIPKNSGLTPDDVITVAIQAGTRKGLQRMLAEEQTEAAKALRRRGGISASEAKSLSPVLGGHRDIVPIEQFNDALETIKETIKGAPKDSPSVIRFYVDDALKDKNFTEAVAMHWAAELDKIKKKLAARPGHPAVRAIDEALNAVKKHIKKVSSSAVKQSAESLQGIRQYEEALRPVREKVENAYLTFASMLRSNNRNKHIELIREAARSLESLDDPKALQEIARQKLTRSVEQPPQKDVKRETAKVTVSGGNKMAKKKVSSTASSVGNMLLVPSDDVKNIRDAIAQLSASEDLPRVEVAGSTGRYRVVLVPQRSGGKLQRIKVEYYIKGDRGQEVPIGKLSFSSGSGTSAEMLAEAIKKRGDDLLATKAEKLGIVSTAQSGAVVGPGEGAGSQTAAKAAPGAGAVPTGASVAAQTRAAGAGKSQRTNPLVSEINKGLKEAYETGYATVVLKGGPDDAASDFVKLERLVDSKGSPAGVRAYYHVSGYGKIHGDDFYTKGKNFRSIGQKIIAGFHEKAAKIRTGAAEAAKQAGPIIGEIEKAIEKGYTTGSGYVDIQKGASGAESGYVELGKLFDDKGNVVGINATYHLPNRGIVAGEYFYTKDKDPKSLAQTILQSYNEKVSKFQAGAGSAAKPRGSQKTAQGAQTAEGKPAEAPKAEVANVSAVSGKATAERSRIVRAPESQSQQAIKESLKTRLRQATAAGSGATQQMLATLLSQYDEGIQQIESYVNSIRNANPEAAATLEGQLNELRAIREKVAGAGHITEADRQRGQQLLAEMRTVVQQTTPKPGAAAPGAAPQVEAPQQPATGTQQNVATMQKRQAVEEGLRRFAGGGQAARGGTRMATLKIGSVRITGPKEYMTRLHSAIRSQPPPDTKQFLDRMLRFAAGGRLQSAMPPGGVSARPPAATAAPAPQALPSTTSVALGEAAAGGRALSGLWKAAKARPGSWIPWAITAALAAPYLVNLVRSAGQHEQAPVVPQTPMVPPMPPQMVMPPNVAPSPADFYNAMMLRRIIEDDLRRSLSGYGPSGLMPMPNDSSWQMMPMSPVAPMAAMPQ